jgi:hypothetical protein
MKNESNSNVKMEDFERLKELVATTKAQGYQNSIGFSPVGGGAEVEGQQGIVEEATEEVVEELVVVVVVQLYSKGIIAVIIHTRSMVEDGSPKKK